MSERRYNSGRKTLLGQDNNALVILIAINVLIFVALNFLLIVYFLSYKDNASARVFFNNQILDWFVLPASLHHLATRPWTIITFMFTHFNIWSLISTVLWLWGFGFILQDLAGNKKLIPVYLYGGFAGAVFFLLSTHFIPAFHQNILYTPSLIGGSAAVMAVAIATTTLAPEYRIFPLINGGIPLWVLTLIFVAIDYASVASSSGSYAVAHLAGGAIGFIFIKQLQKGNDWSLWMINLFDWLNNLFNPEKKEAQVKDKLFYKSSGKPYQKTTNLTQQKLDAILDKINVEGYEMLTYEEKDFLKRASKEEL